MGRSHFSDVRILTYSSDSFESHGATPPALFKRALVLPHHSCARTLRAPHHLRTMRRDQRIHLIVASEQGIQSAAVAPHSEHLAAPAGADVVRLVPVAIAPVDRHSDNGVVVAHPLSLRCSD